MNWRASGPEVGCPAHEGSTPAGSGAQIHDGLILEEQLMFARARLMSTQAQSFVPRLLHLRWNTR